MSGRREFVKACGCRKAPASPRVTVGDVLEDADDRTMFRAVVRLEAFVCEACGKPWKECPAP